MKTKILALLLAASLGIFCTACDPRKKAPDNTDNVIDRANTQKTTDTEKSTVTDIAKPTDVDTQTDINSSSSIVSVNTDSENVESLTDTELIEENLDESDEQIDDVQPQPIEIAGYTLTAEKVETDKTFTAVYGERITGEMVGDTLYILDKNKLYGYYISGTQAEKSSETGLSSNYTKIDADSSGTVYLSGDDLNAAYLTQDGTVSETDIIGKLALSDTMDFGLVYSKSSDNVLKYSGGNTENWALTNMRDETRKGDFNMISNIEIVGERVFVTGSSAEENNARKMGVYDAEGELIMLSDDKTSGTGIASVTDTPHGYMACSRSTLTLWNYDGSIAGISTSGNLSQLFGTSDTVIFNRLFSLNDGTVLALCTVDSNEKTQPVLYRISGF